MKKFLSLVLALVMTMSLVTMAGAKDFTDAADVDYKEAVEVLEAVGVITGYTDGSFRPETQLNRGQAAKIICNLMLGPTTASALPTAVAPFSDVAAGSTFAGYIAYCAKEGIINGYTDGTFKPENKLTGYAFMKMLLGALGYDGAKEGYADSNWAVSVAKQALALGLDDGLTGDFVGTKIVTREEACLYAFNALKCEEVEYKNSNTITIGNVKVETAANATSVNAGVKYYETLFDGKLVKLPNQNDTFGRPATQWNYKNAKVGTYASKPELTYTKDVTLYTVNKDLGLTAASTDPSFYYTYSSKGAQVASGAGQVTLGYYASTDTTTKLSSFPEEFASVVGNGVTVEVFYSLTNPTINEIVVIDEMIGKVTDVKTDDDGRYVMIENAYKFYTDKFAKKDVVLYTVGSDAAKAVTVKAAEKLTGTLNAKDGAKLVIDGVTYEMHKGASSSSVAAGKEVEFYLDSCGYVIDVDLTEASAAIENLVVVLDTKGEGWSTLGKAVFATGKMETVTLKDANTKLNYVYTYTMDAGKLKVSDRTDYNKYYGNDATNGYYFVKGATKITNSGMNVNVDGKTTFVMIDEKDNVKTYLGNNNAPTFSGATAVWTYQDSTKNAASVVFVKVAANKVSTTLSDLVFAIADDYALYQTTSGTDAVSYYNVRTLDEKVIKIDEGTFTSTLYNNYKNAGVVIFKTMNTNNYGIVDYVAQETDDIEYYNYATTVTEANGVLYFADGKSASYTADVAVYEIAANGDTFSKLDADYIEDIEKAYAGYTYVLNDNGLIETVVLKKA